MERQAKPKTKSLDELQEPDGPVAPSEAPDDIVHQLAASEVRYRRLFETAQDGILILDARSGSILDVNPFLVDMLGYSKNEFLGKSLWDVGPFSNTDTAKAAFAELQTQHYLRYDDMPLETKDGRLINVEFVSNVYSVDGTMVVQCNIRDITQRRQAEEALRQNQQQLLQTRDQFLSRMSHELRSPLAPIHQFVTILLDGLAGELTAEQRDYLLAILRSVNVLRTMISDLLEVTRAESGKLHVDLRCVYLSDVIPEVLKTFQLANTKNLRVSFDVPDNLPPVCADMNRVRQILDNLLDNAIKFTPDKGEITVRARVGTRSRGFLRIEVTDTGCGIAHSEREKIFEYLHQIDTPTDVGRAGLGIGLYICRELVSSQGGRIWVNSRLGRGSTFVFTLPVFSLERQLAPVVKAADLITHSVALVTIEVSHLEKQPLEGKADATALQDVWRSLQGCTVANVVVLLPRVPRTASAEFFFIVACVNESGAKVLVEQLHGQLGLCQSVRESKVGVKSAFMLLSTRGERNGALSDEAVNRTVVDHIEDAMKGTLHSKGRLYEWSQGSHSG